MTVLAVASAVLVVALLAAWPLALLVERRNRRLRAQARRRINRYLATQELGRLTCAVGWPLARLGCATQRRRHLLSRRTANGRAVPTPGQVSRTGHPTPAVDEAPLPCPACLAVDLERSTPGQPAYVCGRTLTEPAAPCLEARR